MPSELDERQRPAEPGSGGGPKQTQRALLDAARAVFAEQGFSSASIADVVERAGSSVGSLYHHFGGKSELFLALWQEHQAAHEKASSEAVAQARRAGETDPTALFCVGARAFLEGSWQRRDLAMLFVSGDGPPGFELMKRRREHEWISQNDALLRLADTSLRPALRRHPDLADRRGRAGGGRLPDPAPGERGDRRRDRVRPARDGRRPVEAGCPLSLPSRPWPFPPRGRPACTTAMARHR